MSDRDRVKLFNELCKTCSRHRVIPKSMHIPDCSTDATQVQYTGGFSNVSQSTYEGHRVAIKVLHVYSNNLNAVLSVSGPTIYFVALAHMNSSQGFCREVVAWKHLRHPNILPLLGVTVSENRFAMVSEWMDNGNINEFVRKDYDANRTALVGAADIFYSGKFFD
jgi:serine/threonine protein kinase